MTYEKPFEFELDGEHWEAVLGNPTFDDEDLDTYEIELFDPNGVQVATTTQAMDELIDRRFRDAYQEHCNILRAEIASEARSILGAF